MIKRKFNLVFSPRIVNEPVTFKMVKEYDLVTMDGASSITEQQRRVREVIEDRLAHYHRKPRIA